MPLQCGPNDGTRDSIWANRFDGTSWGTAELIEADNAGNASTLKLPLIAAAMPLQCGTNSDGTSI